MDKETFLIISPQPHPRRQRLFPDLQVGLVNIETVGKYNNNYGNSSSIELFF
jgi:hypothetical protein